jgi:hypothetical protein
MRTVKRSLESLGFMLLVAEVLDRFEVDERVDRLVC